MVIKEGLSEEEATLIVTETNLMQRSFTDLLHSERATVIATRHDAMRSQGILEDSEIRYQEMQEAKKQEEELYEDLLEDDIEDYDEDIYSDDELPF